MYTPNPRPRHVIRPPSHLVDIHQETSVWIDSQATHMTVSLAVNVLYI
jgi:hypothetical protein